MEDNKATEFLDLYKKLEETIIERFNYPKDGTAVSRLIHRSEFRELRTQLDYCREVRNLLSHRPSVGGIPPVQPSQGMLDLLKNTIEKLSKPIYAYELAVMKPQLLSASFGDKVRKLTCKMKERGISYVPILENGIVVGMFSEHVIFSYLADHGNITLYDDLKLGDIKEYLSLDGPSSQAFPFIKRDEKISVTASLFEKARAKHKRIGLLLVTEDGDPKKPLIGIITAWAVAAAD